MNTRAIRFENFRNLGIKGDKKDENLSHTLKLGAIDSENIGGLIVLLGGNNEGKSNVLAGLEALGCQELEEGDVPNFNDYEESEVKISLEYQIKDPELIAKFKGDMGNEKRVSKDSKVDLEPTDFAEEVFGLYFTSESLKKGVEKNECESEEEYISFIEKMLNEQEVYAVYGDDEKEERKEIRLILKDENRMLLCSADQGGKSLKCFSAVEKRYEEIKDKERAILLQCEFKVGKIQAPKGCDDAKILREYLKKSYEIAQGAAQDGATLTPKNTPAPPPLMLKACLSRKDGEVKWHTDLPKEQVKREDTNGFRKYIQEKIKEMQQRRSTSELRNIESELAKAQSYNNLEHVYQALIELYHRDSYYFTSYSYRNDSPIEFKPAGSFFKNGERDIDILKKHTTDIAFIPKIVKYEEGALSDRDLEVDSEELSNSSFFKTLFKILNVNLKSVEESIEKGGGKRKNKARDLSQKCEEISKRFNALYCLSDDTYSFETSIEETKVCFCMEKNGETIYLDQQSVGFRKFFNLFFNFLYNGKVKKGDIVLLDEPENSLSIPAQRELREFLKKFGQEQGITFIICTHSPYMLDVRHLDEVRIVKKCERENAKGSMIENDFSMLGYGKVDVLGGIRKALGANIELGSEIVFVEGIMDTHILNGYAHIYAKNHREVAKLVFLPIGGLGGCEEGESGMSKEQREKAESLIKFAKSIRCHPVLLVDSDKAGRAMKEGVEQDDKLKNALSVLELQDAFEGKKKEQITTIETLLSKEDKEKFGLKDAKKEKEASLRAAVFKDLAFKDEPKDKLELSQESKVNLNVLFSKLIDFKKANED